MIHKPLNKEEPYKIFPPMNGQQLRKAISDASSEINKIGKDSESIPRIDEVVMQAECECCGLNEDCTQDYITRVKNSHSGKWVCGLCSEAVKERLSRAPRTDMDEALSSHRNLCHEFNSTTRLNPKLTLAWAMKDIVKRSCENRTSKNLSNLKIGRTTSCVPRIDLSKN